MRTTPVAILALVFVISCKKDSSEETPAGDKKETTEPPTEPDAAEPADKAPDFSAWNPDEKAKAWEGSWLVKENGKIQAWTVEGTQVTTYDGEADKTFSLEVFAPCRVYFKNDKGMMYPRNFTAVDGALQYRGGGAGYRDGDSAIYCDASARIYSLDGGVCTIWEEKMGKWESSDGDCGIKKNDEGADVFHHADPNGGEFEIKDGAILSKASFPTEKVDGDHEAAKKARDARAAE